MLDLSNLAAAQQLAHLDSPRKKSQLVIDQGEHALLTRALSHAARFVSIHRHRLLAQNRVACVESRKRHLTMRNDRRNDANQIDVITRHDITPIVFDVRNIEFARDFFGMLAMRAGDGDNLRVLTILECWDLRRAGKTRADDPNSDYLCD